MSAAHHDSMAASETTAASVHGAEYNPGAFVRTERCGARSGGGYDTGCWTSVTNATAEHLDEAKKHHQMAADHRAASQALRDAEARACVGLPDLDRDMSPFEHCEDIASVDPLVTAGSGKASTSRMMGATVVFRAVPGMTAPWLQRVVDCHLARNAALGHDVPEMPYCPLVPKDVSAHVAETNAGFAVAVRSDDSDAAREVLRRAHALVTACPRAKQPSAAPPN